MRNKKLGTIYKLTAPDGLIYIGQTWNFKTRMNSYKLGYTQGQKKLHVSMSNHGFEKFSVGVIDESYSQRDLNKKEIEWISHYNSLEKGLNSSRGGTGFWGLPQYANRKSEKRMSVGIPESILYEIETYAREHKLFIFEVIVEAWNTYKSQLKKSVKK